MALAASLGLVAPTAWAQKTYRCGAVYQDRPCAAAQDGRSVNTSGAGQAALGDTRVDAVCARRGHAAQRVAWARESGKTEQEQATQLRGDDRDVLPEVYRRRGSSLDIRRAIEADCMAEKERAAGGGPAAREAQTHKTAAPAPAPMAASAPETRTPKR